MSKSFHFSVPKLMAGSGSKCDNNITVYNRSICFDFQTQTLTPDELSLMRKAELQVMEVVR